MRLGACKTWGVVELAAADQPRMHTQQLLLLPLLLHAPTVQRCAAGCANAPSPRPPPQTQHARARDAVEQRPEPLQLRLLAVVAQQVVRLGLRGARDVDRRGAG